MSDYITDFCTGKVDFTTEVAKSFQELWLELGEPLAGYGKVDKIIALCKLPRILLITAFMLLFGHGLFNHRGQQLDRVVPTAARRNAQATRVRIYPSRRSLRRESMEGPCQVYRAKRHAHRFHFFYSAF